jgi:hypothetical protein
MADNESLYPTTMTQEQKRADFGRRIANAFNSICSSNVFFFLQQAYPEDADTLEWSDFQVLLDEI